MIPKRLSVPFSSVRLYYRLMNLHETPFDPIKLPASRVRVRRLSALGIGRRILLNSLAVCLVLLLAGGSTLPGELSALSALSRQTDGYHFDILSWEVGAIVAKAKALVTQPAAGLSAAEQRNLVAEYLKRAQRVGELEAEINRAYSQLDNGQQAEGKVDELQAELNALRGQQETDRPAVEQIIGRQVSTLLAEQGLGLGALALPPVEFAFVEPPKKLMVSPRERIETLYGQMLDASIPLSAVEEIEHAIRRDQNLSAYVTGIGGLGAFPTMVVDNAGLPWILSTVAHEWTHNYLTFFPLGLNYGVTSDLVIINETVAEIVGDEVGDAVLRRYYPELVPPRRPPPPSSDELVRPRLTTDFDFSVEMRQTRQTVDQLLAQGEIEEAERYMEERRQFFVQHGYPLRVLNQAFFAFHGSYGTGAASTSPLGPQLERLRALTPDVATFLQIVRSFTSAEDVAHALATWER